MSATDHDDGTPIVPGSPLARALTRMAAYFDLAELYEVSFNAGRIK